MSKVAILDANVLFPMVLRDTMLRIAAAGCYRVRWSDRIIDEMTRNLVEQHRLDAAKARALAQIMREAFPEATVRGWGRFEPNMQNHPKDRHVAAAAVAAGASVIVTSNLKDFTNLPVGTVAMSPDAFLLAMLDENPEAVIDALRKQANGYRKPVTTMTSLLESLARTVPGFAAATIERAGCNSTKDQGI